MILSQNIQKIDEAKVRQPDLHIMALGFETRCMAIHRYGLVDANQTLFLQFPETQAFSYQENLLNAQGISNAIFLRSHDSTLREDLESNIINSDAEYITMDISSMNRTMISAVLSCLIKYPKSFELEILYVPAQYSKLGPSLADVVAAGPVLPEFSAFNDTSDLPASVIVGLGYEHGIAVGLINRIEPRNTICLYATGHDEQFEIAVRNANLNFKFPGIDVTTLPYNIFNPQNTYQYLSGTIRNLKSRYRVSLIPLGPKILSSLFVLASIEYFGDLTLWRVIKQSTSSETNSTEDNHLISYKVDTDNLRAVSSKFNLMMSI